MNTQYGFTLIELMIVVAIIAILASVGIPAYQGYTQKAALTDLLQAMMPYKTAVEICALETSDGQSNTPASECMQGKNGIPIPYTAAEEALGYTQSISVAAKGVITLQGSRALSGLTVTLTPNLDSNGTVQWSRACRSDNDALTAACTSAFKFKTAS